VKNMKYMKQKHLNNKTVKVQRTESNK
jgi:hypothetical protein